MNKRIFLITICVLFITTIAEGQPKKHKAGKYSAMPEWVMSKPTDGDYYTGISSAAKQGKTPDAYMAAAQKNALADLAAAISTKIETSSTLYTLETTQQFGYNFSSDIRAASAVDLEGYELMGTWEDANNYWVYYRLSRSDYAARRAEKKRIAIASARDKLIDGDKMLAEGNGYNAFISYCDGLALLKPYLGENTACSLPDNSNVNLGNKLLTKLNDFVSNVSFGNRHDIMVKRGAEIRPDMLEFTLTTKDGIALRDVPVRMELSAPGLSNPTATTAQNGHFVCPIRKIKSPNNHERLFLQIDVAALMRGVKDETVRMIVRGLNVPRTEVGVHLTNPSLSIRSEDRRFESCVRESFSHSFEINNYPSDFELNINKSFSYDEHDSVLFAHIVVEISVTNTGTHEILFRKRLQKDISGTEKEELQMQCEEEICRTMERSLKEEITRNIF